MALGARRGETSGTDEDREVLVVMLNPDQHARMSELARRAAAHWHLTLSAPFEHCTYSLAYPTWEGLVVKVPFEGDGESLHEGHALALWGPRYAAELIDSYEGVLLEEHVRPGTDLSIEREEFATTCAVTLASALWVPPRAPFRDVLPYVRGWVEAASRRGSPLAPVATRLLNAMKEPGHWLVHGDFHHHNIVLRDSSYVTIDPKPFVSDREYDVASFLWNPMKNPFDDRAVVETRIAAFVNAGLNEERIRHWAVIRGSYLRPDPPHTTMLESLLS